MQQEKCLCNTQRAYFVPQDEKFICLSTKLIPTAFAVQNETITSCSSEEQFVHPLSPRICLKCEANTVCNGSHVLECGDGLVLNQTTKVCHCIGNKYLQLSACVSCPLHGVCNGRLLKCAANYKLHQNQNECVSVQKIGDSKLLVLVVGVILALVVVALIAVAVVKNVRRVKEEQRGDAIIDDEEDSIAQSYI